jgi:uncharacterized protein (TIGR00299 family) protein
MKILYYDCFSGISGDMNLGAMIDLGIDITYLKGELEKLNLDGWDLISEEDQRHGITGTKVTVKQLKKENSHRHLSDIEYIIKKSTLTEADKELSIKIFRKLGSAEAFVHNIPIEKVHFHEVGAIDSIIDVVGAAICFNAIGVKRVFVSEVEMGSGFVNCDHGKLPIPAPATIELVKGINIRTGGVDFEATTPTGAAILSVLGTDFGPASNLRIEKTGYGVGHKDHPKIPNLLRISLGETAHKTDPGHKAILIESNIDDMNPEFYDFLSERLFKAGASDVYFSQIIMKKSRPGVVLHVICEIGLEELIKEIIFTESTTVGIRSFEFNKDTLAREFHKLNTIYGEVTVKRSFLNGKEVSVKPEFDECRNIAIEKAIPVKMVYNHIMSEILQANKHIDDRKEDE